MSNRHPHRINWFEVPACLARAALAGAKIVQPTTDIGPFGAAAQFEDLDGNVVGRHAPR